MDFGDIFSRFSKIPIKIDHFSIVVFYMFASAGAEPPAVLKFRRKLVVMSKKIENHKNIEKQKIKIETQKQKTMSVIDNICCFWCAKRATRFYAAGNSILHSFCQ